MQPTWAQTIVLAVCLPALAASAHAGDDDVAALLKANGIRPVQPPSSAADFVLPTLSGETLALSAATGRWVVLTFFATWCGPCAAEMPSLEALHRQKHERGLDVLAVALDDDPGKVKAYAAQKELSFPILLDTAGDTAATYHASSIPVSYLIDPAGRIVGVARGARDWARLAPLFDDLAQLIPADPSVKSLYAVAGGPVLLPSQLVPPTAEVSVSPETLRAGREFSVNVRITWAGSFEDYLLHPPSVHLPDQVVRKGVAARTSTESGSQVVTYQVRLLAAEEGRFALDPVELRYTPRFESQPVASRIAGPTVLVTGVKIAGLSPVQFGLVLLAILAAFGTVVGLFVRRRASPAPATSPEGERHARLMLALEAARKDRLNGQIADFLTGVAGIEHQLGDPGALDETIERARFGGELPDREALDQIQRRVERRLAEIATDPQQEARARLRRDQTREP